MKSKNPAIHNLAYLLIIPAIILSANKTGLSQENNKDSAKTGFAPAMAREKFFQTSDFLDAALNSIQTFNSLVQKENYRIRITSFNNPASTDLGFNLMNEIREALKPLLAKSKTTNAGKFNEVIGNILQRQIEMHNNGLLASPVNPIFSTVLSLVGVLTIQEKKITHRDLDSFMTVISRFMNQYEKLHQANALLNKDLERVYLKLKEIQFDCQEFMMDIIIILSGTLQRTFLRSQNPEQLFLKHVDKARLELIFSNNTLKEPQYPSDGIKTAKEIAYSLQKLFEDYQNIYSTNYNQIKSILTESLSLGKNIDIRQVERSLSELERLYIDSKTSDVFGLRLATLFERLSRLVQTEQLK